MGLPRRLKFVALLLVIALSVVCLLKSLPILFVWFAIALVKLVRLRCWSLFFLLLTTTLLPFGGGLGSPMYVLFAIIVALFVTPLGWTQAEKSLSFLGPRYVMAIVTAAAMVVPLVRAGIEVPIVTRLGNPLLAEGERTYQLERILAWLHDSGYCGYQIGFVDKAGSPVTDVESAITRRNRPPSDIEDVQLFWNTALRCNKGQPPDAKTGTTTVTFGGPALAGSSPAFVVKGKFAGDATVVMQTLWPNLIVQQQSNTLATRQIIPIDAGHFDLAWTFFGYADDTPEMRQRRLRQANLMGPAGLVSLDDSEAMLLSQAGIDGNEAAECIAEMGGRAIHDEPHMVTETAIRGFYQHYRGVMGL